VAKSSRQRWSVVCASWKFACAVAKSARCLPQLLVHFGCIDISQELPLLHPGSNVGIPLPDIAVRARKDHRLVVGLYASGNTNCSATELGWA